MNNLYDQKVISANEVYDDTFVNAKMLYLFYFNKLPSLNYIGQLNGRKPLLHSVKSLPR